MSDPGRSGRRAVVVCASVTPRDRGAGDKDKLKEFAKMQEELARLQSMGKVNISFEVLLFYL